MTILTLSTIHYSIFSVHYTNTITIYGLEEQLLGVVVAEELPELAAQKANLVVQVRTVCNTIYCVLYIYCILCTMYEIYPHTNNIHNTQYTNYITINNIHTVNIIHYQLSIHRTPR
jgi:hypothetical protein